MSDKIIDQLQYIRGVSFRSASELLRLAKVSRKLVRAIAAQPGYRAGEEMSVSLSQSGEWRLYVRVGAEWMDASLHDLRDDIKSPSGTRPDTSIYLGQERRAWLKAQGGIQPTIHRLVDEARRSA